MARLNEWQARPEAGGRFAHWWLRKLAFVAGRTIARVVTYPVALYFMLRRAPERAASRAYLARLLGRQPGILAVYRHFLCFSQVTLDRLYLMHDGFERFSVNIVGLDHLEAALAPQRGALLLSAHLGSFDALRVLAVRKPDLQVRILIDLGQNAGLSRLLNALDPQLAATIIDARRPGPELVLEMQRVLQQNGLVSTLADRLRPGNPYALVNFLGAEVPLPTSPWMLAGALHVPVVIAFGLYRGGKQYDLHFESLPFDLPTDRAARGAALQAIAQRFADRLAHYAALAPYNWFNLYDFWNTTVAAPANPLSAADGGLAALQRRP